MKSSTGRMWRDLALEWKELSDIRGAMLARVWVGIDAMVDDEDLANSLRLMLIGDFIPDLIAEELGEGEDDASEADN